MKKSLLVSLEFPPKWGGVSHSLYNICHALPAEKIVVLTQPSSSKFQFDFKVYRKKILSRSKFIWPKWIFLFRHIQKIVKNDNIDLIQVGHILPIGTVALIFKRIFNIPYLVYVYGQDLVIQRDSQRKIKLIKAILKNAEAIIANSSWTKKRAQELGAQSKKIKIVYPCPDSLKIEDFGQDKLDRFRNENQIQNKKIILSLGNLVRRKGHDMVIKALPQVIKRVPDLIYLIVGTGPYEDKLRETIADLNLDGYVKFFKNVSNQELPYFLQTAEMLIMPSRELKNNQSETVDVEGFGMVFLEANLYGKPVVGGRSGGQIDAIEEGESGLLVDPEDKDDIAQAIIKLANNPALAQKLGQQGKEMVSNKFQWSVQVKKIIELLG